MEEQTASVPSCDIGSSSSKSEKTSNPPNSHVSFSMFGDSNCGEPLLSQRLVIDFTPMETIDNEFAQKKCCAFWDYISSRPDLHNLMVLPDTEENTNVNDSIDTTASDSALEIGKRQKTAVSQLEFVEEKGLINRIFEAKMQQSHCSLGSREYHENKSVKQTQKKEKKTACTCTTICKSCRNIPKRSQDSKSRAQSSMEVQNMNKKLQAWDNEHPKLMDPPGHPPALSHSVMQRKA